MPSVTSRRRRSEIRRGCPVGYAVLPPASGAISWSIDGSCTLLVICAPVNAALGMLECGELFGTLIANPVNTDSHGFTSRSGARLLAQRPRAAALPVAVGTQRSGMMPLPKNQTPKRTGSGVPSAYAVPLSFSIPNSRGSGTATLTPPARTPRKKRAPRKDRATAACHDFSSQLPWLGATNRNESLLITSRSSSSAWLPLIANCLARADSAAASKSSAARPSALAYTLLTKHGPAMGCWRSAVPSSASPLKAAPSSSVPVASIA